MSAAGEFGAMAGGVLCLGFLSFIIVLLSSIKVVEINQQLVFKTTEGKYVKNGPFTQVVWPHQRMERREATRIGVREYAVLKNERTQELRHEPGPGLVFLGAYEVLEEVKAKMVLQKSEYTRLVDKLTGAERVIAGPLTFIPLPLEEADKGIEKSIVIGAANAVLVVNKTSGMKKLITTKGMFVPAPYEQILREQKATLLQPNEYAVVKDDLAGTAKNVLGPVLLQVGAYEELLNVSRKIVLEKDEYVRMLDKRTGVERVVKGPANVVPDPNERTEGSEKAVFLTAQTAVIVLQKTTGQQRLEKTPGVFVPAPYERVLKVVPKIRVLPHQAAIIQDTAGSMTMVSGASGTTAFFLEPFTSLLTMRWSSYTVPGAQEPVPKEALTMLDLRSQKMFFSNEVRTSDNVKLRLEGTIFWKLVDVMKMVAKTSDPSGDVAQRARSTLIQSVSKVTFAQFMNGFTNITVQAFKQASGDGFYTDRGLVLQSMELTKFDCVDNETALVLQKIIQETTNRINELQKAQSSNDVKAAKLIADIKLEKQRTELIKTQAANAKLEAEMQGQADGSKLVQAAAAFIDGLNASMPNVSERVELYKLQQIMTARNTDTQNLASGKAQLFLTPSDLNLKLNMGSAGAPEL
eukprot:TRINITY_DN164_c0_g1_i10.p1 TRINITY_DN164_c0_g1~~TRINITY_DN164_c0_g1_i10.p1  ORF type:complete len:634 (-),score=147.89 TRINITY_DN164_c0_g1_i10:576-2477(-)